MKMMKMIINLQFGYNYTQCKKRCTVFVKGNNTHSKVKLKKSEGK